MWFNTHCSFYCISVHAFYDKPVAYQYYEPCNPLVFFSRLPEECVLQRSLLLDWPQSTDVPEVSPIFRGRPRGRVTTRRQDRFMVLSHLRQRKRTAVETARATFGTHGRPMSSNTVRSRLRSVGIRARRPYRGIVLRGHHRRARVRWARTHLRFTRADWAQVLPMSPVSMFREMMGEPVCTADVVSVMLMRAS